MVDSPINITGGTMAVSLLHTNAAAGITYVNADAGITYVHAHSDIHLDYDSKNLKLLETVVFADAVVIASTKGLSETPVAADIINSVNTTKGLTGTLTVADAFSRTMAYTRNFADIVEAIDIQRAPGYSGVELNGAPLNSHVLLGGDRFITSVHVNLTKQSEGGLDSAGATDEITINTAYEEIHLINGRVLNAGLLN